MSNVDSNQKTMFGNAAVVACTSWCLVNVNIRQWEKDSCV